MEYKTYRYRLNLNEANKNSRTRLDYLKKFKILFKRKTSIN